MAQKIKAAEITALICMLFSTICAISEKINGLSHDVPNGFVGYLDMYAQESNNTVIVEEILRFLQLGDDEIDIRDDETDLVLILGMTGSGKSTLGQFVAGDPKNELISHCNDTTGDCFITDTDGTISNQTIISETLLPNLILETSLIKHTAFYDCPGFKDTRNASVEIANAFFIKKVADHGKRIKIVLAVRHGTLIALDRTGFTDLLEQVIAFLKNPEWYVGGISLVGTQMYDIKSPSQVLAGYKGFLEMVIKEIPAGWTENDKKLGIIIVNALIFNEYENMYFFPMVREEGVVETLPGIGPVPSFKDIKESLRDLIWNKTSYIIPKGNDFGYVLTDKTKLVIVDLIYNLDKNIQSIIENISSEIIQNLVSKYNELINMGTTDQNILKNRIEKLKIANYDFVKNPGLNANGYSNQIISIIKTFDNGNQDLSIETFFNYSSYLTFLQLDDEENSRLINPELWVRPLINILPAVIDKVETIVTSFYNPMYTSLTALNAEGLTLIENKINEYTLVHEKGKIIESFLTKVNSAKTAINQQFNLPNGLLKTFATIFVDNIKKLDVALSDKILNDVLEKIPILEVLDTLALFEWKTKLKWEQIVLELSSSIENEQAWNKFLLQFFDELSASLIQSHDPDGHKIWRKSTTVVNPTNLPAFWDQFKNSVNSVKYGDLTKTTQYLSKNSAEYLVLNKLLDVTLKPIFRCDPVNSNNLIQFSDNYLLLTDVVDCLNSKRDLIETIILFAKHSIIFNADLVISKFSGTPANVLAIAPLWQIEGSSSFSLQGIDGPAPPPKPSGQGFTVGGNGTPGTNASNFVGIFQKSNAVLSVNVQGSNGGNGQGGQDGIRGTDGYRQTISFNDKNIISEEDCAAWTGGRIQIRKYPNSCNKEGSIDYRCHAGDDGIEVTVNGTKGGSGIVGNSGGFGGQAGIGGNSTILNLENKSATTSLGNVGSSGGAGKKGDNGPNGNDGAAYTITVDDVTSGGKRCKRLSGGFFAEDNSSVTMKNIILQDNITRKNHANQINQIVDSPVTVFSPFTQYEILEKVKSFKTILEVDAKHEFFANHIAEFLPKLDSHPNLK